MNYQIKFSYKSADQNPKSEDLNAEQKTKPFNFEYNLKPKDEEVDTFDVIEQEIQQLRKTEQLYSLTIELVKNLQVIESEKVMKDKYKPLQEKLTKMLDFLKPDFSDLKRFSCNLTDLSFNFIDNFLDITCQMKNLQFLEFSTFQELSLVQEKQFKSIISSQLTNLQDLVCSMMYQDEDPLSKSSSQSLPNLQILEIRNVKNIHQLLPLCHISSVQSLSLSFPQIAQKIISQIFANILKFTNSSIKSLKLSFYSTYDFRKDKFLSLIENYADLEILDIKYRECLQKEDLNLQKFSKLRELKLHCHNPLDYLIEFEEISLETITLENMLYQTSKKKSQKNKIHPKFNIKTVKYVFANETNQKQIKKFIQEIEALILLIEQSSTIEIDTSLVYHYLDREMWKRLFELFSHCNVDMKINLTISEQEKQKGYHISDNFFQLQNRSNFTINQISYYQIMQQIYSKSDYLEEYGNTPYEALTFVYGMAALEEEYCAKHLSIQDTQLSAVPSQCSYLKKFKKIIITYIDTGYFSQLIEYSGKSNTIWLRTISEEIEYLQYSVPHFRYLQAKHLIQYYKKLQFFSLRNVYIYRFFEKIDYLPEITLEREIQLEIFVYVSQDSDLKQLLAQLLNEDKNIFYFRILLQTILSLELQYELLEFVLSKTNHHLFIENTVGSKSLAFGFHQYSSLMLSEKIRFLAFQKIQNILYNSHLLVYYDLFTEI